VQAAVRRRYLVVSIDAKVQPEAGSRTWNHSKGDPRQVEGRNGFRAAGLPGSWHADLQLQHLLYRVNRCAQKACCFACSRDYCGLDASRVRDLAIFLRCVKFHRCSNNVCNHPVELAR